MQKNDSSGRYYVAIDTFDFTYATIVDDPVIYGFAADCRCSPSYTESVFDLYGTGLKFKNGVISTGHGHAAHGNVDYSEQNQRLRLTTRGCCSFSMFGGNGEYESRVTDRPFHPQREEELELEISLNNPEGELILKG